MAVSYRSNAIMMTEYNETKAFPITVFLEVHVEQVEIVAENQYLKIGILKQNENQGFQEQEKANRGSVHIAKADYPRADLAERAELLEVLEYVFRSNY